MNRKQVMLITTKQPSSNPRLVKEAITLSEAGYTVFVVYNFWSLWAETADKKIINSSNKINWIKAGYNPVFSKFRYWFTRLRFKLYKILASVFINNLQIQEQATTQFYPELKKKACSIKAALYIAHNIGALPVAVEAAKKNNAVYAFDAEDFHRSQSNENTTESNRARLIENKYFEGAGYITAASSLIAAEYKKNYPAIDFTVVNNVFSKQQQPSFKTISLQTLRLFWFSQTVGLNRGVQDVIAAINLIYEFSIELTILGDAAENVRQNFSRLLSNQLHHLNFIKPCDEEKLIAISSQHHIGLAVEPGFSLNNQIALSNKLFTYLLAGNALILSNTPAQQLFYKQYPEVGWCYHSGDSKALASILQQAHKNVNMLENKRQIAWQLACTQLNWETEKETFLKLVKTVT